MTSPLTFARPPLAFALAALLAGCGSEPEKSRAIAPAASNANLEVTPPTPGRALTELQPVRIRVHPLTRLERDPAPSNRLRLVCYLELADRWGHPCKWLGHARVELYRPSEASIDSGAGTSGGGERQENVWNIDLADAELNAQSYDWVTRTYRLDLVGLPDWVERLDRGDSREPWATLRAYFLVAQPDGSQRRMEASTRIRRAGEQR